MLMMQHTVEELRSQILAMQSPSQGHPAMEAEREGPEPSTVVRPRIDLSGILCVSVVKQLMCVCVLCDDINVCWVINHLCV